MKNTEVSSIIWIKIAILILEVLGSILVYLFFEKADLKWNDWANLFNILNSIKINLDYLLTHLYIHLIF